MAFRERKWPITSSIGTKSCLSCFFLISTFCWFGDLWGLALDNLHLDPLWLWFLHCGYSGINLFSKVKLMDLKPLISFKLTFYHFIIPSFLQFVKEWFQISTPRSSENNSFQFWDIAQNSRNLAWSIPVWLFIPSLD